MIEITIRKLTYSHYWRVEVSNAGVVGPHWTTTHTYLGAKIWGARTSIPLC